MKKPDKKRIDEVAAKLRSVYHNMPKLGNFENSPCCHDWRRLAKFVLTDLQPAHDDNDKARWPKSTLRPVRGTPAVKSCKIVRGKTVCK
jgi:hypothetical protein